MAVLIAIVKNAWIPAKASNGAKKVFKKCTVFKRMFHSLIFEQNFGPNTRSFLQGHLGINPIPTQKKSS